MLYLRWAIAILAAGRAIYSLPYFLAALTGQWLVMPWVAPDPNVLISLGHISAFQLLTWTLYMIGYFVTAGALVWPRNRRALEIAFYAALVAVLLDLGYWIWVTTMPIYMSIESPAVSIRDAVVNGTSLAILLGAALVYLSRDKN